ncbi:MAG: hypothetical protein LBP53_03515 [Candidatus Peribacteria bacterium]|jgi:hypothetical protein|nr:hypothetical protein [Candidatus Peribacteria bacterium]
MKPFTRYLLYYLVGRVFVILFTTFIFPENGFRGFIECYRRYLIIVSLSYFTYCYFIDETEQPFLSIKNILFIGNCYLALHLFFRPLLHIEPALFLLLGMLLLGLRAIRKRPARIRQPLNILGMLISVIILISGLFYLYPEAPDKDGFIAQQHLQLITISDTQTPKYLAYLKITDLATQRSQDLLFSEGRSTFSLPASAQISYIATQNDAPQQVFLLFPEGNLVQIPPQSIYTIEQHTLKNFSTPTNELLLFVAPRTTSEFSSSLSADVYYTLTSPYRHHLKSYLIQQTNSPFIANATLQQLNKAVLKLLATMFPGFFTKNLQHYEEFQSYFSLATSQPSLLTTNKYTPPPQQSEFSLWKSLRENMQLAFPLLYVL